MANLYNNCGGGADPKKLYEALQYSGLVNSSMTYDEMISVLANKYPKLRSYSFSGTNTQGSTTGVICSKMTDIRAMVDYFSVSLNIGNTGAYNASTITIYFDGIDENGSWQTIKQVTKKRNNFSTIDISFSYDRASETNPNNNLYRMYRVRFSSTDGELCKSCSVSLRTISKEL